MPPYPCTRDRVALAGAFFLSLSAGAASAAVVTCDVVPPYWTGSEGETAHLTAVCDGALASIDWRMDGVSVSGVVPLLDHVAWDPIGFSAPVGVGGANSYAFTVVGVPAGTGNSYGGSSAARVVVKGTTPVVAKAAGITNPTVAAAAQCGTANNTSVGAMPTGSAACATGARQEMAITSPQGFGWNCESLSGGEDAYCWADYGSRCGPADGVETSVIPPSGRCAAGNTASGVTTTTTAYTWTCTAGTAPSASCSAPRTAAASVNGVCGTAAGVATSVTPTANLCASGTATSVIVGSTQYTWTCSAPTLSGTTAFCTAPRGYTVTATAGANGSISPASKAVAANTTTTFTVTPNAGYVAAVTGCGGTLSGSTYTTGAVTANCSVSATFTVTTSTTTPTVPTTPTTSGDPGIGKGLWVPPNTSDRVIADQSGPSTLNLTDYVPGCLNGLLPPTASASGCGGMASYTGTLYGTSTSYTFQYGSGKTLGLRFMSKANAGTSMKYFLMYSGDGGSTGGPVSIWLSQDPTATYATTPAACKSQSTTQPYVITGPGYCPIEPNKMYYLFTKVDSSCTNCRYRIEENASDFY